MRIRCRTLIELVLQVFLQLQIVRILLSRPAGIADAGDIVEFAIVDQKALFDL